MANRAHEGTSPGARRYETSERQPRHVSGGSPPAWSEAAWTSSSSRGIAADRVATVSGTADFITSLGPGSFDDFNRRRPGAFGGDRQLHRRPSDAAALLGLAGLTGLGRRRRG